MATWPRPAGGCLRADGHGRRSDHWPRGHDPPEGPPGAWPRPGRPAGHRSTTTDPEDGHRSATTTPAVGHGAVAPLTERSVSAPPGPDGTAGHRHSEIAEHPGREFPPKRVQGLFAPPSRPGGVIRKNHCRRNFPRPQGAPNSPARGRRTARAGRSNRWLTHVAPDRAGGSHTPTRAEPAEPAGRAEAAVRASANANTVSPGERLPGGQHGTPSSILQRRGDRLVPLALVCRPSRMRLRVRNTAYRADRLEWVCAPRRPTRRWLKYLATCGSTWFPGAWLPRGRGCSSA